MHYIQIFGRPRVAHNCRLVAIWGGILAFLAFLVGAGKPPGEQNPLTNPALIGAWTSLIVALTAIVMPILAVLSKLIGLNIKVDALDARNTEMTSESVRSSREAVEKVDDLAARLTPRTVLVVDDSAEEGTAMCRVLAKNGFAPMLATDAKMAMTLLGVRPEQVIVDLNLSSGSSAGSGWDVIDAIARGGMASKPVIFSGADPKDAATRERLRPHQKIPYFVKPDSSGLIAYLKATSRPIPGTPALVDHDSDPDITPVVQSRPPDTHA